MKNFKQQNWYKIGFLIVCGAVFILTLYLAAFGAIDRAYAFATWMNGGFPVEDAQCAMAFGESIEIN